MTKSPQWDGYPPITNALALTDHQAHPYRHLRPLGFKNIADGRHQVRGIPLPIHREFRFQSCCESIPLIGLDYASFAGFTNYWHSSIAAGISRQSSKLLCPFVI